MEDEIDREPVKLTDKASFRDESESIRRALEETRRRHTKSLPSASGKSKPGQLQQLPVTPHLQPEMHSRQLNRAQVGDVEKKKLEPLNKEMKVMLPTINTFDGPQSARTTLPPVSPSDKRKLEELSYKDKVKLHNSAPNSPLVGRSPLKTKITLDSSSLLSPRK
ncbi:unnamed protein product [Dimorphilus gyrociliatus]|uniref:Uncharacterized protein n=1 Tax=Dimorphilus gyrociliatus TaxID=2664684 RepID=A0A7I8V6T3_9ANNE|nr:unnamed protein product [Dimorphilus gyrociliatus]